MKKLFTLIAVASLSLSALATDYTANIRVTVGGESVDAGETTISVDDANATAWSLTLKNFTFSGMPIGNITLANIPVEACGLVSTFAGHTDEGTITEGTDADVDAWMGPMLGQMPIDIKGRVAKNEIQAVLLINMCHAGLGVIRVEVGNNAEEVAQLPNSGFERFHTAKAGSSTSDEPDGWHSFMSCQGSLASAVRSTSHTAIVTDDLRPGTTGTRALKIFSTAIFGVSANGTITTGRLNAGSMTATNTDNHSFADLTLSDTDDAGDPFYAVLTTRPDSIAVWVKYHVGARKTANKNYVYATLSAALTDGTYYQDPQPANANYTNIVAKASNTAIEGLDAWERISIPFDYASYTANQASPKTMLITMSTCAQPGGGSTNSSDADILLIDDISLVYNTHLAGLTYDGKTVDGFDPSVTEYHVEDNAAFDREKIGATLQSQGSTTDIVVVADDEATTTAYITVKGDDLSSTTYTLTYTDTTPSGIDAIDASTSKQAAGIYDLSGRRVKEATRGGIYVVRTADGAAFKMIKR